jgi:pyrophosphatase PpaX
MIEAILFDLDGTIHDSRDVVFDCVERTFSEFECAAPDKQAIVAQVHAGSAHLFDQLAPKTHTQEMLQYFRDLYKTEQNKIQPYDDAKEVISKLHADGYRLGVVSSARAAEEFVVAHGLAGFFDVIVGGNATKAHKPNPEPIHFALGSLAVPPEHAIMVGDLPADIEAGHNAGLKASIAIAHGFGERHILEQFKPDYFVDNFEELYGLISNGLE